MHYLKIKTPHHAVARLSLKERLRLPNLHHIFENVMVGAPTSPLLLGEEQGEGLCSQKGIQGNV